MLLKHTIYKRGIGMKKKYVYNAAIYRRGIDGWAWQGEVVAYNKKDAMKKLQSFRKKEFGNEYAATLMPIYAFKGEKKIQDTGKPGVYTIQNYLIKSI